MNYLNHYNLLIKKSKERTILNGLYERHHIIPKCMNGSNDNSNLVYLTPKEHCIAHLLLAKAYPEFSKLIYASRMMYSTRSSRKYDFLRKEHSNEAKKIWLGKERSIETRIKISNSNKGKKPSKKCIENSSLANKSDSSRLKKSLIHKELWLKDEHRNKMRISQLGKKQSEATKIKRGLYNTREKHHNYGRVLSEETKLKISRNHADLSGGKNVKAKKVLCIDTGKIFDSISDAARFLISIGFNKARASRISSVCCNKRKSAYGYKWSFI